MSEKALQALYNLRVATAQKAIREAQIILWEVQLVQYPDSKCLTVAEAATNLTSPHKYQTLAQCLKYPLGVFYVCNKQPDGSYQWSGFRYGIEPQEYLSFS